MPELQIRRDMRDPIERAAALAYPAGSFMKNREFQRVPITMMTFNRLPHPVNILNWPPVKPGGTKTGRKACRPRRLQRTQADEAMETSERSVTRNKTERDRKCEVNVVHEPLRSGERGLRQIVSSIGTPVTSESRTNRTLNFPAMYSARRTAG
jgi:hypothetical protein